MKTLVISLLYCITAFAFGEDLKISVKVLDRTDEGAAIRGQYVYPSAELTAGEIGSMHIGREKRYPVWVEKVELGDGVSKEQTTYEETPVGLLFSIEYVQNQKDGVITYKGKAMSKVSRGTIGTVSTIDSTEVIFYGKSNIGELIQVEFDGADGTAEEILIYFGPTEE